MKHESLYVVKDRKIGIVYELKGFHGLEVMTELAMELNSEDLALIDIKSVK